MIQEDCKSMAMLVHEAGRTFPSYFKKIFPSPVSHVPHLAIPVFLKFVCCINFA